ncbi:MAG: CZB domain-containing protein, partial [Betaproteobacteria bacterium]|nr:CZB domain-containing protein [Betaproteobacteria bacterium]
VTQQNAALVEQAAAAAESLEEQAQALAQAVSVFALNEGAGSAAAVATPVEGLDFDGAINAHRNWKRRLLEFVGGKGEELDPAIVGRDDKCALGCWIYGDGRAMQGGVHYGGLKHEHAAFHHCAADVIRRHQEGESRDARALLAGEFSERSSKVIGLLEEMKKERNRHAELPPEPASRTHPRGRPAAVLSAPAEDDWAEF